MLLPLAIMTTAYSTYVYMSFDQITLDIWYSMFYPSITLILQVCVVYGSLANTYPCILYDLNEYERPVKVTLAIYILAVIAFLSIGKMLYISLLYVNTLDNGLMIILFQSISFIMLFIVCVSYFIDALRYCSGWAYCDYLKNQGCPDVQYSVFPFTLKHHEMNLYLDEKIISRRAHVA